jgi:hypothetical protein
MPKINREFKDAIARIPHDELQKLVVELARKHKEAFDFIELKYLSRKEDKEELFQEYLNLVNGAIFMRSNRGPIQKSLAKAIAKAVEHINYYQKLTKDDARTAELLVALLDKVFSENKDELGTCFTALDSKLAVTTNRLYNLVTKKFHPDYLVDFRGPLNRFLKILQENCRHLNYVFEMPTSVPE